LVRQQLVRQLAQDERTLAFAPKVCRKLRRRKGVLAENERFLATVFGDQSGLDRSANGAAA
jgi:hypothetical protein